MSEPCPTAPVSVQCPTIFDGLAYVKAVKDVLKDDKDKYDEFLEVLKDSEAQRIDIAGVIARVKYLFRGHRELILGFNAFLPEGLEIILPVQGPTTFDCLSYLKAAKDMFKDDKHKYDEFLEVMKDYKAQKIDVARVIARVRCLFRGHRELILGFNAFLPEGFKIILPEEEILPKK